MTYDNTNTGTFSKNDRKEKETHPDVTGSFNVEGVEYWFSAWQKRSKKDGSIFYSGQLKRKEARQEPQQSYADQSAASGLDDEIPF